ncbi:hypothetical protein ACFQ61_24625 [Streptomyces sp. NPDC056500]|uniref:hypothetical protein n=1 Tax=Streptomyces sp. NPDC056500 TaxID=3345840 RepID=UPI0036A57542
MPHDGPILPPVRLRPDAELARAALAAPLLARAVRLARWAGPETRVGAGGELVEEQLPAAAEVLGLGDDSEGPAYASEAWRTSVDAGLLEVHDPADADTEAYGTVTAGEGLELIAGAPRDVLAVWQEALEAVYADAIAPLLDDLSEAIGPDGEIDYAALDWDPDGEAEFLDGVLGNLYLLTVTDGPTGGEPVPLPALAASMIVPDDMGEPTDDILEQVSVAMMRLDDQFRLLEPIGLVEYQPVDETLMVDEPGEGPASPEEEDLSRYGLVKLTPLGLHGVRVRLLEAGVAAPVVGELADKGADVLLDGLARYPEAAAGAETEQWLARREPAAAAHELLAAARGSDAGGPLRRLRCQQALVHVGAQAEPEVRAVLDDAELGGLARVWLAERGAADVPAPPESMVFWLSIDTIAAQLDADGEPDELRGLVEGLTGQHSGFFDAAWRVDHPATADVLEAMGRMHPNKRVAKEARKAAFKARSR